MAEKTAISPEGSPETSWQKIRRWIGALDAALDAGPHDYYHERVQQLTDEVSLLRERVERLLQSD